MARPLRLRPATPADIPLLEAWDAQPHVRAATGADSGHPGDPDDDWSWDIHLAQPADVWENWIAERDTPAGPTPIGFVQIIDPALEPTHYWGPDCPENPLANHRAIDIWIGPPGALGQGHGTAMMALAHARCFADPAVEAILIDPLARNIRAIRFYRRLGYEPVGPRTFGNDDCLVLRLTRARWEALGGPPSAASIFAPD